MKILVQTSIYLESGETLQKVIEITSNDIKVLAESKAKEQFQCLSANAKRIEWSGCLVEDNIYGKCMSIENVQQMMLDFADSRVANTNYCSDIEHRDDVFKFFEEWRQDNDC